MNSKNIMEVIKKNWRRMNEGKKMKYEKLSQQDRKRYDEEKGPKKRVRLTKNDFET